MSNDPYGVQPPDLPEDDWGPEPTVDAGDAAHEWGYDPDARGRPANIGKRTGAIILDGVGLFVTVIVVLTITGIADRLVTASLSGTPSLASTMAAALVVLSIVVAYFALLEAGSGQTLGKRMMGIKVVMADGSPTTLQAAFLRRLPMVVAMIVPRLSTLALFGVGLAMLVTAIRNEPSHQGFHDRWAGTLVIEV
ncbi:MAG TPA: RDD family protein [Euzebyales bacterium]|nr:RDD family protein [Euzebyales bacterium]